MRMAGMRITVMVVFITLIPRMGDMLRFMILVGDSSCHFRRLKILASTISELDIARKVQSANGVFIADSPAAATVSRSPIRGPPSLPQITTTDGVFLVNSEKATVPPVGSHPPTQVNEKSSGLAWYREVAKRGDGQQPGAYIDIKQGGTVFWEGVVNSGSSIHDLTSPCSYRLDANTVSQVYFQAEILSPASFSKMLNQNRMVHLLGWLETVSAPSRCIKTTIGFCMRSVAGKSILFTTQSRTVSVLWFISRNFIEMCAYIND
jgi:hypothetical protein